MRSRTLAGLALTILAPLALMSTAGCDTFERNTFNTLSSSKAVLDTAQQDYEPAGTPIKMPDGTTVTGTGKLPHNRCAYTLINDGKASQTVAVNALQVYDQISAKKGDVTAQEAQVVADLAPLLAVVAQVKQLYSNPAAACASVPATPTTPVVTTPSAPTSLSSPPNLGVVQPATARSGN